MKKFWRKYKIPVFIIMPILLLLTGLVSYEFEHTSTNEYCGFTCHNMIPYYQSSFHNVHREGMQVNCRDCHIPQNNIAEALLYKGYSGIRDVYKNTFVTTDVFVVKGWSKKIIQRNCIRCHQSVVERINTNDGKLCFECHRGIPHDQSIERFSTQNITSNPRMEVEKH